MSDASLNTSKVQGFEDEASFGDFFALLKPRVMTLVVFTAGTEGATFRVPGLPIARARQMRDRILAARGDDVI